MRATPPSPACPLPRLRALLLALGALVASVALLSAGRAAAGRSDYSLREWHVQDGLPHDEVSSVRQARDGYIWAATAEGLARFDGVHFEDFSSILPANGASRAVRAMAETADSGLVLASEAGGVWLLRDGIAQAATFARDKVVNALFAEPDGTLWMSCEDRTVLRQHGTQTESFGPDQIPNGRPVAYFARDGRGRVWIATGTFLARYEQGRLVPFPGNFSRSELRVASSRGNGPWIVTQDRVYRCDGDRLDAGVPVPPLVGAHYVRALFEDHAGQLWLGTRSQGLFAINQGTCRPMPSSSEDILAISEDTEGDIWVATNGGGLDCLRPRDFQLFDQAAGLLDNFSYTVCQDEEGTIWFGNRDGGLARARDGIVETVPPPPSWSKISAMSVFPDGHGGLWVTGGTHVHKLTLGPEPRWTRIDAVPSLAVLRVSLVARNGDLWLAIDPDKIARLTDERFDLFGRADGFEGRQVRCIAEDPAGRIWAGTADGRVLRFDGTRFEQVSLDRGGAAAPVQAIYFDPGGTVWLGTAGRGLLALTRDGVHAIDRTDGLADNFISQIIADDRGYLWFGSTRGIFYVARKELDDCVARRATQVHPTIVGRDDGVKGISCLGIFQPAAWKARDGRLWFATRKGVLSFDPATVISDDQPPPVSIAEVMFDSHPHALGRAGPLRVPATVRRLEFRFSVLRFSAPDRVQVKYRLDGFDSEWLAAGPDRIAVFPTLPPGSYELQVIASLGNGLWSERPLTWAITVPPRWWQRLDLQVLLLLGLVAAVAAAVRAWSHRRLRRKLERLERESAIERERTRIARNIHDDLGASLTRISLLTQCAEPAGEAAHAARINHIYQTAGEIIRSMDEIVWAVDPRHDNLESLAGYFGNFAQKFLGFAGIRCRLAIPDRLPALGLTSQMRHHLFLCFKEALNNVVRHAAADAVTITLHLTGRTLTIQVADNGAGLNAPPADTHRISTGHGLENMRQRMAELGGRFSLERVEDRETVITFTVELAASSAVVEN